MRRKPSHMAGMPVIALPVYVSFAPACSACFRQESVVVVETGRVVTVPATILFRAIGKLVGKFPCWL